MLTLNLNLLYTVVNILVLFLLLRKFLYKPVMNIIAQRQKQVDDALNAAEEWTVDPEQFHSKARNTPFGGWQVTGRPLATIIGSQLMFSRL